MANNASGSSAWSIMPRGERSSRSNVATMTVYALPSPTFRLHQPKLQFVNINDPGTLSKSDTRKLVRAHAARAAHSKTRRSRMANYRQSKHSQEDYDEAPVPGPVRLLGSGRVDPFGTFAINCTAFEHALIDHYVTYLIPNPASHFSPMGSSTHTGSMYSHWVPYIITDPGMMNGVFLAACRNLAHQTKNATYMSQALKYKGECIRSIATAIETEGDAVSDLTIAKVLFLASDEFHTGNMNGATSHTKAIGDMVKIRGGEETLGLEGVLRQLVLWNDRTLTFYNGTMPNFMHTGQCQRLSPVDQITPGFRHYFDISLFSYYVGSILNDMCYFTKTINAFPSGAAIPPEVARRINDKELDVRLLILSSDHRCPSSERTYKQVEECLALALMVYLSKVLHPSSRDLPGSTFLLDRFKDTLSILCSKPKWRDGADLVLWIVFMASYAVYDKSNQQFQTLIAEDMDSDNSDLSDVESFLLELLCEVFEALDIRTFLEMKTQLQNFMWIEKPCVGFAMELFSKVTLRSQTPKLESAHTYFRTNDYCDYWEQ